MQACGRLRARARVRSLVTRGTTTTTMAEGRPSERAASRRGGSTNLVNSRNADARARASGVRAVSGERAHAARAPAAGRVEEEKVEGGELMRALS